MLTNHGAAISQQIYHSTLTARADDESYKGFKIYPAANSEFAVGKNGLIQKSKFKNVEDAKKWIDSRDDTLLPPNPELQSAMALGGPLAMENAAAAVDTMVEQLNSLGKEAEALVERATRADADVLDRIGEYKLITNSQKERGKPFAVQYRSHFWYFATEDEARDHIKKAVEK